MALYLSSSSSSRMEKFSFDLLSRTSSLPADVDSEDLPRLSRSKSDVVCHDHSDHSPLAGKHARRKKRNKRKKQKQTAVKVITTDPSRNCFVPNGLHIGDDAAGEDGLKKKSCNGSFSVCCERIEGNASCVHGRSASLGETEASGITFRGVGNGDEACSVVVGKEVVVQGMTETGTWKLRTQESLEWDKVISGEAGEVFSVQQSQFRHIVDEIYTGNALKRTTCIGSEKDRERVYDTIFRLPWRCELLICVGFFVCFDAFLSLLTIMPTRIALVLSRLVSRRKMRKVSAEEICDISYLIVLISGVLLLGRTDISLIYHMIRGQGTIKLYVVYNVLEIFDKLCQSFGGDVFQALFNSVDGLANCISENLKFWLQRLICDQILATAFSILHSFILLAQAITLSTCIVAHNNALWALLVSNNFAEIKSNVFKRFSKENIHSLVYSDSVERFHISAFLLFVLAQHILDAEGPWFTNFLYNAATVFGCEMLIDIIKHSFLAKFNDIKPITYSEFLEDLCNQTLDSQLDTKKKNLTFVPLAPACVVIRVLTPVYAALLPSPFWWRCFWVFLLIALTYVMLTSLKIMISMALQKHATWYIKRCNRRKLHLHAD